MGYKLAKPSLVTTGRILLISKARFTEKNQNVDGSSADLSQFLAIVVIFCQWRSINPF